MTKKCSALVSRTGDNTMKTLHAQNRIVELMSFFVTQVKATSAMSRTDINHVAETILIPLFREVYGYKKLKNLNSEEGQNYPGIDLGDEGARVAIQVTSTTNAEKIKHTLEKFVEHGQYNKYDRVIVYILTEKQKTYSGKGFNDITKDRFQFDKNKDILDYSDLLAQISTFQVDRVRRVEQILEANFGHGQTLQFGEEEEPETEAVFLNLLEVSFPDQIYVADIDKTAVKNEEGAGPRARHHSSARDRVRDAMKREGIKFAVDWECHAGQIITFHDLRDPTLPISRVTDLGTATPLSPEEFFEIDRDHENVFKSLLARCLQQKLYRKQINWQNEDKLYIFSEKDGKPKRNEKWVGRKKNERGVYWRTMKRDEPETVFFCKHLAFETQFYRLGDKWYIGIRPEWFFSDDGYKRSFYAAEKIKYLKKKEKNRQVFYHLQAIVYLIKHDEPSDLFVQTYRYPFLSFGNLVSLDGAPKLDDNDWLPGESKEEREKYEADEESMEKEDSVEPLHLDI